MKPVAYCGIREAPAYRHEAFIAGLRAQGFRVDCRMPSTPPAAGDVLMIWNRYSDKEGAADLWERHGGTVLVAENGYCGRDAAGHQLYAIATHGHNGSGEWPRGGPERWQRLGLELKPWRSEGLHVLVCPNRHFGMKGLAMPVGWTEQIVKDLRRITRRPVRVRPHPNGSTPERPLADDLENAHCVLIWASSAGVHALLAGVPVVALSPWWIVKGAAGSELAQVEQPVRPERLPHFERLAWAQWTVEEIARGEPFDHLLRPAREEEVAAGH